MLGIATLVALILATKATINIVYEDQLKIYLKVLFLKFRLYPERKKKFNIRAYEKKQKKEQNPLNIKLIDSSKANAKAGIVDNIKTISSILSVLFKTFTKHLHVKLAKIHIKIATPDAAQTAILYGAASASLAYVVELLDSYTKLHTIKERSIYIEPDFLSEKSEIKINISLSLSVFGALITIINTVIKYYTLKETNNRKEI